MPTNPKIAIRIVLTLAGATSVLMLSCTPQTQREAMEAYAPADRIRAVESAAKSGDMDLVPALVDRLDDEEVAVRMAAIEALERLTGKTLGYVPWAPFTERRTAVEAWRADLKRQAPSEGRRPMPPPEDRLLMEE